MTWPAAGGGGNGDLPKLNQMASSPTSTEPGLAAVGTWSGGRFMGFGEKLDTDRYLSLITPDSAIPTVITADVYGVGEADRMLGRAIQGRRREEMCIVGAVGHDFYEGERDGAKGFPRFTDPRLRTSSDYAQYLTMATERSLERCGSATPATSSGTRWRACVSKVWPPGSAWRRGRPTDSRST
jgi:hypothetical protein